MSNYDEDVKEVADLILEIENETILEKLNSQKDRVAAYGKHRVDIDAVDRILNEVLGWNKK